MKIVVYTSVFGGYDRIFSPVVREPEIDYVIFTEDPELQVTGWKSIQVDKSRFADSRAANRYYKMLGHRVLADFDISIYVDGNVRLLGGLNELARNFAESGAAIGAFPHSRRHSVAEEVETCVKRQKGRNPELLEAELASYREDGFPDTQGLIEAGVMLKLHLHSSLNPAMELWWSLFERHGGRDQISFPYVQWKTGLSCHLLPGHLRGANTHFGLYPHLGSERSSPWHVYFSARAYDSRVCRLVLRCWEEKWAMQRKWRSQRARS